jgi:MFS superfamily sulfate permease-like transporter
MLPICIVLTVILVMVSVYTNDFTGIYFGILIMIVWGLQALITHRKMKSEQVTKQ